MIVGALLIVGIGGCSAHPDVCTQKLNELSEIIRSSSSLYKIPRVGPAWTDSSLEATAWAVIIELRDLCGYDGLIRAVCDAPPDVSIAALVAVSALYDNIGFDRKRPTSGILPAG